VPITQSALHTTTSPARASRPDLAERIFSLIVFPTGNIDYDFGG
jgi:hypothetical protein